MLTFQLQNAVDAKFRNGETFELEGAVGIVADYIAIRNAFTLTSVARLEFIADAMVWYTMHEDFDRVESYRAEGMALIS